jgi:hypothetical protein
LYQSLKYTPTKKAAYNRLIKRWRPRSPKKDGDEGLVDSAHTAAGSPQTKVWDRDKLREFAQRVTGSLRDFKGGFSSSA